MINTTPTTSIGTESRLDRYIFGLFTTLGLLFRFNIFSGPNNLHRLHCNTVTTINERRRHFVVNLLDSY